MFEDLTMLIYAAISIISMFVGYAFSVSAIMKQSEENTELRVQLLEVINRERALLDEYRDFVEETKVVNEHVYGSIDQKLKLNRRTNEYCRFARYVNCN
jgi:hypothetical protein